MICDKARSQNFTSQDVSVADFGERMGKIVQIMPCVLYYEKFEGVYTLLSVDVLCFDTG